jgi:hypothetical protein
MEPIIIRKEETPTTDLKCQDCDDKARAVWLDDGGAAPLCDSCVEARRKAHQKQNAGMLG